MACTRCGAAEHEVAACPKPAEPDKVDQLIARMTDLMQRANQPKPELEPEPAPAPVPGMTEEQISAKFEELVNQGKSGEAYKFVRDNAINPQMRSMYEPLLATMGQQAVQRLSDKFGDKFAKREDKFKKLQKEYGISDAALANPKTLDDLWLMTCAKDPTYKEEEYQSRLDQAKQEWENENKKHLIRPAGLGPAPVSVRAELKDDAERYLTFDEDPVRNAKLRTYLDRQLTRYGVSHEEWLEQRKIEEDPNMVEKFGEGPFSKRTWTRISPDKKGA